MALIEDRTASLIQKFLFWLTALTFAWALFVVPPLAKRFLTGSGQSWLVLCGYPLVCWVAAAVLLKKKSRGRVFLAALNVASGVTWAALVLWAARTVARSFWR